MLDRDSKIVDDKLRISLLSIRSDIEVILGIQKRFLGDVSQRSKGWNEETCLADIFIEFCNPMKTYFSYMNHYQSLVPLLRQTNGTPFGQAVEEMKKPACNGKGLRDFLIMPAQRIPRYAMLLTVSSLFPIVLGLTIFRIW